MTAKVAKSFYSTAISHRDIPGVYLASYAIPGQAPQYVTVNGQVRIFHDKEEAELAGFKVMVSKLNKAQDVQEFVARSSVNRQPRPLRPVRAPAPTIESVFGKKK